MVIWCIFSRFGVSYQGKSGNPGPLFFCRFICEIINRNKPYKNLQVNMYLYINLCKQKNSTRVAICQFDKSGKKFGFTFVSLARFGKRVRAGLPDFSWSQNIKTGKVYQMTKNFTKRQ
jgi:hypothetical protein